MKPGLAAGRAAKAVASTIRFLSPALWRFATKPGTKLDKRKGGRYAGRVRLAIVPDRSAELLCGFVECAVVPGTSLVTDDPTQSFTPEPGSTLHVGGVGNNRIGKEHTCRAHGFCVRRLNDCARRAR